MKKVILDRVPKLNIFYGYDATDLEVKSIHDRAIVADHSGERLIRVDGIIAMPDDTDLPKALMMLSSKDFNYGKTEWEWYRFIS